MLCFVCAFSFTENLCARARRQAGISSQVGGSRLVVRGPQGDTTCKTGSLLSCLKYTDRHAFGSPHDVFTFLDIVKLYFLTLLCQFVALSFSEKKTLSMAEASGWDIISGWWFKVGGSYAAR